MQAKDSAGQLVDASSSGAFGVTAIGVSIRSDRELQGGHGDSSMNSESTAAIITQRDVLNAAKELKSALMDAGITQDMAFPDVAQLTRKVDALQSANYTNHCKVADLIELELLRNVHQQRVRSHAMATILQHANQVNNTPSVPDSGSVPHGSNIAEAISNRQPSFGNNSIASTASHPPAMAYSNDSSSSSSSSNGSGGGDASSAYGNVAVSGERRESIVVSAPNSVNTIAISGSVPPPSNSGTGHSASSSANSTSASTLTTTPNATTAPPAATPKLVVPEALAGIEPLIRPMAALSTASTAYVGSSSSGSDAGNGGGSVGTNGVGVADASGSQGMSGSDAASAEDTPPAATNSRSGRSDARKSISRDTALALAELSASDSQDMNSTVISLSTGSHALTNATIASTSITPNGSTGTKGSVTSTNATPAAKTANESLLSWIESQLCMQANEEIALMQLSDALRRCPAFIVALSTTLDDQVSLCAQSIENIKYCCISEHLCCLEYPGCMTLSILYHILLHSYSTTIP
jgi:hypothetical protein